MTQTPPAAVLHHFGLSQPRFVVRTGIAQVWQVQTATGRPAALKLYHDGNLANEAPGIDLMRAWNGGPSVEILDIDPQAGAVVMEWLAGPSLGDLSRSGRDREAVEHLATVASDLRRRVLGPIGSLPRLRDWFGDLFTLKPATLISAADQRNLALSAALARGLLGSEGAGVALHGDLHHDNIRRGARGFTAFDAKGLWAEPCFELANAFRNPEGFDPADPAIIAHRANRWSARLGFDRARLLAWAAAKAGLSIAWQLGRNPVIDPDESVVLAALCAAVPPDARNQYLP